MDKARIEALLKIEDQQLSKLNQIVIEAEQEEKLLSSKLSELEDTTLGLGGRVADRVARFGGSWAFILTFLGLMGLWFLLNTRILSRPYDPYPFILLNLVLSTIAAIQAPVILMSQNRAEEKDRKRAINDYIINLKAEIEIRNIHQKLDLLISEQMKALFEIQRVQVDMLQEVDSSLQERLKVSGDKQSGLLQS